MSTADPAFPLLTAARSLTAVRSHCRPKSPAELAQRLIPDYHVTPTIKLLSDALERAVREPGGRFIITCPPRTGKTKLTSVALPVWALSLDPNTEIIIKSHSDTLAEESSAEVRALIAEHGEHLGIDLRADRKAVGRWRVDGARGGMLAGGIFAGTVGFGANLLLIDDPIKSRLEADSPTLRRRLYNEFKASLMTRLMPGGSVVIILTRWSELDLAGQLIADDPDTWEVISIPAVSTPGVPDALERDQPGVALTSANGFTAEEFAAIRRQQGEREWAAQYLGVPTNPEGGLVKQAWLDDWRLAAAPARPQRVIVGVDPSDSGRGDACGIVAASISGGVVALIADVSAPMTAEQWARRAVDLAVEVGADEIAVECYTAGETYQTVLRNALARAHVGRTITITPWRGKGGDVARSAALLQAFEVGTARIAGHLPDFEAAAVTWQDGQHQPDSLAAAVIAHDRLRKTAGHRIEFGVPLDNPVSMAAYISRRIG